MGRVVKDGAGRIAGRRRGCRLVLLEARVKQLERENAELRRARQLMRHERDVVTGKLQFVLERMPIGCLLLDEDFRITYCNAANERLFGFTRSEVLGRRPSETFVSDVPPEHVARMKAALREASEPVVGFYRSSGKDGRSINCEWHNATVTDPDGRISGFICMAVDVTERMKVQEALKLSEQVQMELNSDLTRTLQVVEEALSARIESEAALLRSEKELKKLNGELKGILDAVEEGLILYAPSLEVVWSNRGALPFLHGGGETAEEPLCADFPDPAVPEYIRNCFATALPYGDQVERGDGRILDIRVYPILDDRGGVESVLEVARDVTRIITQQAQAVRTAHLVSLGELAAGVAHEINNPTHGIINYAEHLARKFPGEKRVEEICSRIVKEGERIAHIVRALLDFSRKRDGGKVRARIEEVVSEALTLCKSQLRKDNIRLFVAQEEKQIPEILADPQQIVQVILNLVSNARYSLNQRYPGIDAKKSVVLSVGITLRNRERVVRVTVRDHGTGIPQDNLGKVFNPFFTTKPSGVGTGLGLSVSNSIIADHGGAMEITSRAGEGTAVTFLLPLWRKDGR